MKLVTVVLNLFEIPEIMLSFVQQHLLTYLKTVNASPVRSVLQIYQQLSEKEQNVDNLKQEISVINQTIKQYDLEIIECTDELTSENNLVLVNTVYDEITQRAKFYDKSTTQFLSEIVKNCILSENGRLTETECLNLSTTLGLTKTTIQDIMDDFTKDKWLIKTNGTISLGMRTIVELQHSIKHHYPNIIKNCPLCRFIITQGHICSNCNAKYHFACLKKYYISVKRNLACIKCNEVFNDLPEQVSIGKVLENEDLNNTGLISASTQSKRKKTH